MDVARTMFHESLGHVGLRAAFGDQLKPLLSQMVKLYRVAVENKAVEYGFAEVDEDGNFVRFKSDAHALRAAEEVLAELAETRPTSTWVKRAIAAIRQWLRDNLPGIFGDMQLSDADIVAQFIVPARDAIVRGGGSQGGSVTVFSRSDADQQDPFWQKIQGGESFTEQEELDALSISKRRLRRSGRVVERGTFRPGAGEASIRWDAHAGRDAGFTTRGAWLGQSTFAVAVEPEGVTGSRDDLTDSAGVIYSFSRRNDGSFSISVSDAAEGSAAREFLQRTGQLEDAGTAVNPYVRWKIGTATSRALIQEAIRRLAIATKSVPTIVQEGRDTGARAGSQEFRVARPQEVMTHFMRDGDEASPFFSGLSRAVERADMKAAGAQGWKMFLKGQIAKGAIKQDEVTWSGVEEWLDMQPGKVSREAVADYLRANGVRVTETVLSDAPTGNQRDRDTLRELGIVIEVNPEDPGMVAFSDEENPGDFMDAGEIENAGYPERAVFAAHRIENSGRNRTNNAKYGQYTLPGGTRYREVLLTLPAKEGRAWVDRSGNVRQWVNDDPSADVRKAMEASGLTLKTMPLTDAAGTYKSGHWDQPNILAHIRVNDRTDAEGKRVLFVEELQSDYAQDARRKGLNTDMIPQSREWFDADTLDTLPTEAEAQAKRTELLPFLERNREPGMETRLVVKRDGDLWSVIEQSRSATETAPNRGGVPPAPFIDKTDKWLTLALKRVIKMAVDEGYDAVALINGEQSAERYDLSKQVETIAYWTEGAARWGIIAKPINGSDIERENLSADDLEQTIGKEVAAKIVNDQGREDGSGRFADGVKVLSGLDLKVGGEGMRKFYDAIIPSVLKDVLRKVGGGALETVAVNVGNKPGNPEALRFQIDHPEIYSAEARRMAAEELTGKRSQQPGFTITPAMREKAAGGMPMFRRANAEAIREVMPQAVMDRFNDAFTSQRGFNRWWHRTVGTQLHKAKINPEFGRVYYAVQDFMKDVSRIATRAADRAPDLLPQIETLKDIAKKPPAKKDMTAASAALFDGTLRYKRDEDGRAVVADDDELGGLVWTDEELRARGASDEAINLYRQARAAIDTSLDNMLAADIYRMLSVSDLRALAGTSADADTLLAQVRKAAASDDPRSAVKMVQTAMQDRLATFDRQMKSGIGEQAETVKAMRATTEKALKDITDKVDRIDSLKEAGYAPLMRFGQYTVDVLNKDGKRVFFGMYESQMAANMAARKFREQGLMVQQGVQSKREFEMLKGLSPETAKLFAELLGVEQNEAMQEWLKNAVAEQSALKRHIRRKGIEGFDDDASRVVAAFLTSNARAASRALHSQRAQEAVENVRAGDVKDEAIALADYVNNPVEEAQAIRSLLFVQHIGGSVASAAVNLTQTFVQTFPYLAQYGGAAKAGKRIGAAMKEALGKIDPQSELGKALKRAEDDGVIKPQEVFQLQAEASRTLGSNIYVRKVLAAWGALFQLAEQYNRRVAFIASFKTAQDEGIADPFAFAENAVDETQSVFNKGNRPNWSRGAVGATLFTFKTFTIQYIEFLSRLPMEQRLLALAVLVMLSGARGLPFAEDAEDIVDTVAQNMGYNWTTKDNVNRWLVRELGQGWADFIQQGFSGISGVPLDVSQRLGMADLLPGTGVLKPSETRKEDQVLEVFGVAGSLVRDTLKATPKLLSGDVQGAVEAGGPVAIRNVAKAVDMYDMGMYRDTRGRKIVETDAVDAILKGVGFQPSNVARETRAVSREYEKTALYRKVRNDITERMALGRFEGDREKMQEAREALARWNEQNPDTKIEIDGNAVLRRVREMRKDRRERFIDSAPRDIRRQTAEALQ
jgi:hypothetical protein